MSSMGVSRPVVVSPLCDEEFINRARGGDIAAYEELVRRHQHIAFRTALVFAGTSGDAEDAVQEAFVKAWRALGRFRAGEPFRPWLLAIVANEARSRRRSEHRRALWIQRAADGSPDTPGAPDPELLTLTAERRDQLLAAIGRLAPRDREVLVLRFLLDLGEREMAVTLGCRPGTIKSRLSRALQRLREELEP